jgi:hypothetical protein
MKVSWRRNDFSTTCGELSRVRAAFQAALFEFPASSWRPHRFSDRNAPVAAVDDFGGPRPLRPGRLRSRFCCLAVLFAGACAAANDPWDRILGSIGATNVAVVRSGTTGSTKQWLDRIDHGAFVILEGESDLAVALGFQPTEKHVVVRSMVDLRAPSLSIIWEKPLDLRVFEIPKDAVMFAVERWEGAPVLAGIRRGTGAALWMAAPPGKQGYERFPYLLQALHDLGFEPPFRSRRLWAFFDSAYRSRVDLEYFAQRWRGAGMAALHVAAWHYFEREPKNDQYLRALIDACHRNGILVYAWLELPHVSERFWADHPEWREKTALLQDAQLDWRKLMNLTNPDASAAVAAGTRQLLDSFDWDGVNLAELYFESLEGAANVARFTPMNSNVREEFSKTAGVDPLSLFQGGPQEKLRPFLDYRAGLARRLQAEWIGIVSRPNLDLVLTHVDDRFDTRMRDLIGADAAAVLPMLDRHDFTFLVEDPATIWHLGPERYPQIAARYQPLTSHPEKLAIDINVVERYQDVYPTKQQTGVELFELLHVASAAFPRVALYFENSILAPDVPLLSAAASSVIKAEQEGPRLVIDSRHGAGIPWQGPAAVDGRPWPMRDAKTLWLTPGAHVIEHANRDVPMHLVDFNGDLQSASAVPEGVEFAYAFPSRAIAVVDVQPARVEVDGSPMQAPVFESGSKWTVLLPRGQHLVTLFGMRVP